MPEEEGSPPQMDPCQHLRDRVQQLGQEIIALQDLLDSGEAPPTEAERMRAEIRRLEAERSQTESELDECEQEATKEPAMLTFGQPTFQSDENFVIDISPDKRALTLNFSSEGFEVSVGPSSPAPIATRAFFLVLPLEGLEGGNERVEIEFTCSTLAITTEGATATLVLSVNDQTLVANFPENSDQSVVPKLEFTASSASECRISVLLLVGRDSKNPNSDAFLSSSTIDAQFPST